MRIDELNYYEKDFMDIDTFFNTMELTKKQKEDRKDLAYDVKDSVLFLFTLLTAMIDNPVLTYSFVLTQFKIRYREEISKHVEIDNDLERYISDVATSIVSTSFTHLEAYRDSTELIESEENVNNDNFFNSEKRAILIAENESQTVMNYDDYNKAIEEGCTKKKWVTQKDMRVRKTHREVDNEVIPINDYFIVGTSLMLYPHDIDADPEEIIGCRCTIKYIK